MSHAARPLASMTGFARTQHEAAGLSWVWELRSVNSRGLDLRFRLPPGLDALEPPLRDATQKAITRGSVNASLNLKQDRRAAGLVVDEAGLEAALAALAVVRARLPDLPPPSLDRVLALPGVLRPPEAEDDAALRSQQHAAVLADFASALAALAESREAEGARLASVLHALLDEISALVEVAAQEAASQPAQLQEKLLAALASLNAQVPLPSEERLAQEVALLAARADVREELDRLRMHIEAARALLAEAAGVGRKLDFLAQEFNREANTLCSKSASAALTAIGLRLKAAIERLREQVQNVA
jgi:uncharacterized protein (TIGR00255 family)